MLRVPIYRSKVQVAEATVDDDMGRFLAHRWSLDTKGYARRSQREPGTKRTLNFAMHREVMGLPKGTGVVDHINGDVLDNRRENLRVVTHRDNLHNRKVISGVGSSRYRGVSREPGRRWRAQVMVDGVNHQVGMFDTEDEAAAAVAAWRREHMPNSLQESA